MLHITYQCHFHLLQVLLPDLHLKYVLPVLFDTLNTWGFFILNDVNSNSFSISTFVFNSCPSLHHSEQCIPTRDVAERRQMLFSSIFRPSLEVNTLQTPQTPAAFIQHNTAFTE